MAQSPHHKEFIKLLRELARYQRPYEVFRDFVTMAAFALHNGICRDEELEDHYKQIIQRYEAEQQPLFGHLLGILALGLEVPHDFLGAVFMELDMGNSATAQFFTPYEVSLLNAKMVAGDCRESILKGKPYVTVSDPACGAGGMIIAFYEALQCAGIEPQRQMWAHCTDIDPVAAYMTYVQLSLLGIPAVVITGCSLRMTVQRAMYTPAHFMGGWGAKLRQDWAEADAKELLGNPAPAVALPAVMTVRAAQLGLFEIV